MRTDLPIHRHRHADFIKAVEQTMLAERINIKAETVLKARGHRLALKVDVDGVGRRHLHQPVNRGLWQHDRQDAILKRIA